MAFQANRVLTVLCLCVAIGLLVYEISTRPTIITSFSDHMEVLGSIPWSDTPTTLPAQVSDQSWRNVKIYCYIMTTSKNVETKLPSVRATWLRRCDDYVIITDAPTDPATHSVHVPNTTYGREWLWTKTRFALKYLNDANGDSKFDYFIKADDDSYVVMERLKMFLANYDAEDTNWFGFHFHLYAPRGYMAGGSGYVLSRATLNLLVHNLNDPKICRQEKENTEDMNVGRCLSRLNATPVDTRDELGRHRFLPLHLHKMLLTRESWLNNWSSKGVLNGSECCSDTPISYHYVTPDEMYKLEYFNYHVRRVEDVDKIIED